MQKNKLKIVLAVVLACAAIVLLGFDLKPVFIGKKIIFVEIADNPIERAQGLKGRHFLAQDRGMLFYFEQEEYPHFWMKDTLIPLDIAFIDKNKKIIDIQHMAELDDKSRYVPKNKAKYALEMNLGWFERNRIIIGDKLLFKP